jgi:hypothetical protein
VTEPDLTAALDEAEDVVMGRAETVVTEWGIRHADAPDGVWKYGTDEQRARKERGLVYRAAEGPATLVRRTVTYGPWEAAE